MNLVFRRWTAAAALLAAGVTFVPPAEAGMLQIEPLSRMAMTDAGWVSRGLGEVGKPWLRGETLLPAGAAGLRAEAAPAAACDDCGSAMMAADVPHGRSTLSVNVAILVLGSLWVTLMIRRVQQRLGSENLNGGARPHAAGGH